MTADRPLTCQELVELLSDYVEGALSLGDRQLVQDHLERCGPCLVYFDQLRKTIEMTGRLRAADVPPEAELALLAAFRDWRNTRRGSETEPA